MTIYCTLSFFSYLSFPYGNVNRYILDTETWLESLPLLRHAVSHDRVIRNFTPSGKGALHLTSRRTGTEWMRTTLNNSGPRKDGPLDIGQGQNTFLPHSLETIILPPRLPPPPLFGDYCPSDNPSFYLVLDAKASRIFLTVL